MILRKGTSFGAGLIRCNPFLSESLLIQRHRDPTKQLQLAKRLVHGAANRHVYRQQDSRPVFSLLDASRRWPSACLSTSIGSRRTASTVTPPRQRPLILRILIRALVASGFLGLSVTAFVVAFFIYDASTYRDMQETGPVVVPELALHPRRGGPKNLPIAEALVDDIDEPDRAAETDKPRLVILGGGWGVSALSSHFIFGRTATPHGGGFGFFLTAIATECRLAKGTISRRLSRHCCITGRVSKRADPCRANSV